MTDLDTLTAAVCDHLPEGWALFLVFRKGEVDVEIYNPKGERVEPWDDFPLVVSNAVTQRVDFARCVEGMQPHFNKDYSVL